MTTQTAPITALDASILAQINPKNHERFSPNLYAWLVSRRQIRTLHLKRVFKEKDGLLWIGYRDDQGDVIGVRLYQVLTNGRAAETGCYPGLVVEEVTDFWERYVTLGRCAIDPEHKMHFIASRSRWEVNGDHRRCTWCGHEQWRHCSTRLVTREHWENEPAASPEQPTHEPVADQIEAAAKWADGVAEDAKARGLPRFEQMAREHAAKLRARVEELSTAEGGR